MKKSKAKNRKTRKRGSRASGSKREPALPSRIAAFWSVAFLHKARAGTEMKYQHKHACGATNISWNWDCKGMHPFAEDIKGE